MPDARIGTSGWHYKHWGGGIFYPEGVKTSDWLRRFAGFFDTVEINNTFYHLPQEETFEKWRNSVPEGFKFAAKASRFITQMKRLKEPEKTIPKFLNRAALLGPCLGPVLFQLPPTFGFDRERLRGTLDYLSSQEIVPEAEISFEFRHPSWLRDETYEMLEQHGAALCLSDMGSCPVTEPLESGFVYVRRHGPAEKYAGCYSEDQLAKDAERVHGWTAEGRSVYVYFNNDIEGYAVRNALRLKQLVREREERHGG